MINFLHGIVDRHLEQNPLFKAGNHGKERLFTLEDNKWAVTGGQREGRGS